MIIKSNPQSQITKEENNTNLFDLPISIDTNNLICIAARPGMGKTALALHIALEYAKINKKEIYIFSLELSAQQIYERLICYLSEIDIRILQSKKFKDDELKHIISAKEKLKNMGFIIKDNFKITENQIIEELKKSKNCGMVIVENLQFIQSNKESKNRKKEISNIVSSLKKLSKDMGIPVIISTQLPRSIEYKKDKHPTLRDLSKVSNVLKRKSDTIIFPYRYEYYNTPDCENNYNRSEINIAKNKYASKCIVLYNWKSQSLKFCNPR